MQDDPDEERVRLVDPVPEITEFALRVDQDVGNVLDIPHFAGALTHFHQGIEVSRGHIGRIEPQTVGEFRPPAGCQLPVLALDVVYKNRMRPGE